MRGRRYFEPEYRRRMWDKREHDKQATEHKERHAAEENCGEKITAAIHRVEQELKAANNEHTPQKNCDRLWERWGIAGLWAAALVGVSAVLYAHVDSSRQIETSQRPWVGVENIISLEAFDPSKPSFRLQYLLRNYGHFTANVMLESKIIANIGLRWKTEPTDICTQMRSKKIDWQQQQAVFPLSNPGLLYQDAGKNDLSNVPTDGEYIPTVVGCVVYRSDLDDKLYQTPFVANIAHEDPAKPGPRGDYAGREFTRTGEPIPASMVNVRDISTTGKTR